MENQRVKMNLFHRNEHAEKEVIQASTSRNLLDNADG